MNTAHTPPPEILAQIAVNRMPVVQLLCSPRDLQALAYGWLFTQGIIGRPDEVSSIRACQKSGLIRVSLHDRERVQFSDFRTALSSGCGGGQVNLEYYLDEIPAISSPLAVGHDVLKHIMDAMYRRLRNSPLWEGMHCAALARACEPEDLLTASDIGRHNAVDKVLGKGLLSRWEFSASVLGTSGRLSSDMVLKAHRAGVPVIVSQHSVTSMAVEIARAAGITLVSRFGRRDEEVFGCPTRIVPVMAAS